MWARPRSRLDEVGEEPDLADGTAALAREAGGGGRFRPGAYDEGVAERVDLIDDLKQEACNLVGRAAGERERGGGGEGDGSIDLGSSGFEEARGEFGSGGGITSDYAAISFC